MNAVETINPTIAKNSIGAISSIKRLTSIDSADSKTKAGRKTKNTKSEVISKASNELKKSETKGMLVWARPSFAMPSNPPTIANITVCGNRNRLAKGNIKTARANRPVIPNTGDQVVCVPVGCGSEASAKLIKKVADNAKSTVGTNLV